MPQFIILTGNAAAAEQQLNELKLANMIKVIGFSAIDEDRCQILLVATPKQQDEDMMD